MGARTLTEAPPPLVVSRDAGLNEGSVQVAIVPELSSVISIATTTKRAMVVFDYTLGRPHLLCACSIFAGSLVSSTLSVHAHGCLATFGKGALLDVVKRTCSIVAEGAFADVVCFASADIAKGTVRHVTLQFGIVHHATLQVRSKSSTSRTGSFRSG
jgi:hypothetical protein